MLSSVFSELDLCNDDCDIVRLAANLVVRIEAVSQCMLKQGRLQRLRIRYRLCQSRNANSCVIRSGQVALVIDMRLDALLDNLLVEKVVTDAVCRHNHYVVVLDFVIIR